MKNNILKIYGISQDPDTKDYILVLQILKNEYLEKYCEKCYKKYCYTHNKWCKLCQVNYLKNNFIISTSGNDEIDHFVQDKQLKIDPWSIVFEWIPYNQFNEIKELSKNSFDAVHSAIWKDGPLHFDYEKKWTRKSNKEVTLKCFYDTQNNTSGILNLV